jgi:hypothetical protein
MILLLLVISQTGAESKRLPSIHNQSENQAPLGDLLASSRHRDCGRTQASHEEETHKGLLPGGVTKHDIECISARLVSSAMSALNADQGQGISLNAFSDFQRLCIKFVALLVI